MKRILKMRYLLTIALCVISITSFSQNGEVIFISEGDTISGFKDLSIQFIFKDGTTQAFSKDGKLDYYTPVDFDKIKSLRVVFDNLNLDYFEESDFVSEDTIIRKDEYGNLIEVSPMFKNAYSTKQDILFYRSYNDKPYVPTEGVPGYLQNHLRESYNERYLNYEYTLWYHIGNTIVVQDK